MTALAAALMVVLEELLERPELFGPDSQTVFDRLYAALEVEVGCSADLHLLRVTP
jgi:hypothetical protein